MQAILEEEKISHVRSLLEITNKERDEAVQECMDLQRCILHLLNNNHHQAAPSRSIHNSEPLIHLNSSLQANFNKDTLLKLDIDCLVDMDEKTVYKDSRDYFSSSDILDEIAAVDDDERLNSSCVQVGLKSNQTLSGQSSSASTAASNLKNIVEDESEMDMPVRAQVFSPLSALFSHEECNDLAQGQYISSVECNDAQGTSQMLKRQQFQNLSMTKMLSESQTKSVSLSIVSSDSVGLECHSLTMASSLHELGEMENKSTWRSMDKELLFMELSQTPTTYTSSESAFKLPFKRNFEAILTSDSLDDAAVSTLPERGRLLEAVVKSRATIATSACDRSGARFCKSTSRECFACFISECSSGS